MFQRMGLGGLLSKIFGILDPCRMPCIIQLISGMMSTSTRHSHDWSITLLPLLTFFPLERFPYSMCGSNASVYERENENVFIFLGLLLDTGIGTLKS